MTQFFIGLGSSEFALLLGKPTHDRTGDEGSLPDIRELRCLRFAPGTGLLLKKGVWHDFPMAIGRPVTCITGNSEEVVQALISMNKPEEMDRGDVYKVSLPDRFQTEVMVEF